MKNLGLLYRARDLTDFSNEKPNPVAVTHDDAVKLLEKSGKKYRYCEIVSRDGLVLSKAYLLHAGSAVRADFRGGSERVGRDIRVMYDIVVNGDRSIQVGDIYEFLRYQIGPKETSKCYAMVLNRMYLSCHMRYGTRKLSDTDKLNRIYRCLEVHTFNSEGNMKMQKERIVNAQGFELGNKIVGREWNELFQEELRWSI